MSEHFDASWLTMREPVDHRSRSDLLLAPMRYWMNELNPLRVLDLGAGTGSNLRYLAPRLDTTQHWTLVDHDAALLKRVHSPSANVRCETRVKDLRAVDAMKLDQVDLVTASALLDLVSKEWLEQLAAQCAGQGAAALFALNYNGAVHWSEPEPEDAAVLAAFNAHHRGDKGFGPALGSNAGPAITDAFRQRGYQVITGISPWQLTAQDRQLQRALLDGWCEAACEQDPARVDAYRAWSDRRRMAPVAVTVGHLDVLAIPPVRP